MPTERGRAGGKQEPSHALLQVEFYQRSTNPTALEGSPDVASGSSSSDDPDVEYASPSDESSDDADSIVGEDMAESLGDGEQAADVKRQKSKFRAEHQGLAVLGFNAAERSQFLNVSESLQIALQIFHPQQILYSR